MERVGERRQRQPDEKIPGPAIVPLPRARRRLPDNGHDPNIVNGRLVVNGEARVDMFLDMFAELFDTNLNSFGSVVEEYARNEEIHIPVRLPGDEQPDRPPLDPGYIAIQLAYNDAGEPIVVAHYPVNRDQYEGTVHPVWAEMKRAIINPGGGTRPRPLVFTHVVTASHRPTVPGYRENGVARLAHLTHVEEGLAIEDVTLRINDPEWFQRAPWIGFAIPPKAFPWFVVPWDGRASDGIVDQILEETGVYAHLPGFEGISLERSVPLVFRGIEGQMRGLSRAPDSDIVKFCGPNSAPGYHGFLLAAMYQDSSDGDVMCLRQIREEHIPNQWSMRVPTHADALSFARAQLEADTGVLSSSALARDSHVLARLDRARHRLVLRVKHPIAAYTGPDAPLAFTDRLPRELQRVGELVIDLDDDLEVRAAVFFFEAREYWDKELQKARLWFDS
jgi:hypothetical protein